MEYTAYDAMASRELATIAAEAAERFDGVSLVVEHRIGTLALGDVSVAIAARAPAPRAHALDATRFVIEELKRRVPDLEARALRRRHARVGGSDLVDRAGSALLPRLRAEAGPMTDLTLKDQFGRSIEYLRISVTDRCNFRCVYCMPLEGIDWLPKAEILTYEEITEVVRQLAPLGLRRLRITGGEPTIRPDLVTLVAHAEGRAGHRGHRALDQRREAPRALRAASRGGPRPREHQRRLAPGRSHREDRAAQLSVRSGRLGARRRSDAGLDPDQAQRRRHARHQRRRDRRFRAADARPSVARALHRAHAGRRDGEPHVGARGAERGSAAARERARRARAGSGPAHAATARRRTIGSPARRERSA